MSEYIIQDIQIAHLEAGGSRKLLKIPELVRCADCANLAVGDDGSRWCSHWDKKVPVDGFCHLGEEREVSNGDK